MGFCVSMVIIGLVWLLLGWFGYYWAGLVIINTQKNFIHIGLVLYYGVIWFFVFAWLLLLLLGYCCVDCNWLLYGFLL